MSFNLENTIMSDVNSKNTYPINYHPFVSLIPESTQTCSNIIMNLIHARNVLLQYKKTKKEKVIFSNLKSNIYSNQNILNLELDSLIEKKILYENSWASQIYRLSLPKLAKQLALNSWKENIAPDKICLHVRTSHAYLNSITTRNILRHILSIDAGLPISLTVLEDNNLKIKTPLEWYQIIYQARLRNIKK